MSGMGMWRRWRKALGAGCAAAALASGCLAAGPVAVAQPAGTGCGAPVTAPPRGPVVVSARTTPYGRVLVVGSGAEAGCSLYLLTSDALAPSTGAYGCTAVCATDIWPALLSAGAPVAGPGVNPTLLGTVTRTDIVSGRAVRQVTYAGAPLYRFLLDARPGDLRGADLFDPRVSPPGLWYLVSPARGLPAPGTATLTPESVTGTAHGTVLSVLLRSLTPALAVGVRPFPVYTFSADAPPAVACVRQTAPRPGCSVFWPPVLTRGRARARGTLPPNAVGIIVRPDRSHQVTAGGRPLYLFVADAGSPGVANGNGKAVFGGTFATVPLP